MAHEWSAIRFKNACTDVTAPHEAGMLYLDCSKANHLLKWHGVWTPQEAVRRTVQWYRDYITTGHLNTEDDLKAYIADAEKENLEWTK